MADKITCRLQTPPDENGKRTDIHFVTTTDEVIVDANTDNPTTLTEKLKSVGSIYVSTSKPKYACTWGKLIRRHS